MSLPNTTDQLKRLELPVSASEMRNFLAKIDSAVDLEKIRDDTAFVDAGADSLDFFNIIVEVQQASGLTIPDGDIEQVTSIEALVSYLNARSS